MASFDELGRALRWVRTRQGKKQYEVAKSAKVTKAMLSSYENQKQRPTLETLERLLEALEIDLEQLAYAIRAVRDEDRRSAGEEPDDEPTSAASSFYLGSDPLHPGGQELHRTLGLSGPLDPAQEQAVLQILQGFHSLLRYVLRRSHEVAEISRRLEGEPIPRTKSARRLDETA
jgi:transcriptional regulator with XRE-family HTH domain